MVKQAALRERPIGPQHLDARAVLAVAGLGADLGAMPAVIQLVVQLTAVTGHDDGSSSCGQRRGQLAMTALVIHLESVRRAAGPGADAAEVRRVGVDQAALVTAIAGDDLERRAALKGNAAEPCRRDGDPAG